MMSDDVAKAVEQEDTLEQVDLFDMSRATREEQVPKYQNIPEILPEYLSSDITNRASEISR